MFPIFASLLSLISTFSFADERPAADWSCETALAPVPLGGREMFAGYIALPSGSELFVRIEKPQRAVPKKWILPLHGLLDSHRAWDAVTAGLIADGYAVVRPDLRGFARSLHDRHPLPDVIDYRENVRDIVELIHVLRTRFQIEKPRVVAHSMSGGLALPLLVQPGIENEIDERVLLVNPYVYRSEFYYAEKMNWTLGSLSAIDRWTPEIFKRYPQAFLDALVTDPSMRYQFANYFEDLVKSRGVALDDESLRRVVNRQVDVAIATVKGLRPLDALEAIKKIPPRLKVDMVHATFDDVVEPPLARKLARAIKKRGGTITEIRGHHRLPEEFPEQIAELIVRD